jgi:hypothetical protein
MIGSDGEQQLEQLVELQRKERRLWYEYYLKPYIVVRVAWLVGWFCWFVLIVPRLTTPTCHFVTY